MECWELFRDNQGIKIIKFTWIKFIVICWKKSRFTYYSLIAWEGSTFEAGKNWDVNWTTKFKGRDRNLKKRNKWHTGIWTTFMQDKVRNEFSQGLEVNVWSRTVCIHVSESAHVQSWGSRWTDLDRNGLHRQIASDTVGLNRDKLD